MLIENSFKQKRKRIEVKAEIEKVEFQDNNYEQLINEEFFDVEEKALDSEDKEEPEEKELKDEKEQLEIETEIQPIEADATFLNNLYLMGYPHEVAKQALIIVKNAGIAEAIDVIP